MSTRETKALQLNVPDTRTFQKGNVAQADTRVNTPITGGDATWQTRMFQQMGGEVAGKLNQMADVAFSNLYLEGQAKVGLIESEDELQGNPLTRDWKVAGYRDTMGKLALADSEAQFSLDIVKLREGNPEDMQAYLAKRRNTMMPGISGMSREARASAAGQLLLQDRAAIKKYTSEHTKYIIESTSAAITTQWNSTSRALQTTQVAVNTDDASMADLVTQTQAAAGVIVGSVWGDARLPTDAKQKLTTEMIQGALDNQAVTLYDYLRSNEVPDGNGGKSTLLARLDPDQQHKLSQAYGKAMADTADMRNLQRSQQVATIKAGIHDGTYKGTYPELLATLDPMVGNGSLKGGPYQTIIQDYLQGKMKTEVNSELSAAYLAGDAQGVYNAGKTMKDGANAVDAMLTAKQAPLAVRMSTFLQAGQNGSPGAFEKVGEILGVSLRQMRSSDGTMLPQHVDTFRTINAAVTQAEKRGDVNARMQVLAGLSEPDRLYATSIMRQVDSGRTYDEASRVATEREAQDANLSPGMRAARAQASDKALLTTIEEVEPRGLLSTLWTWGKQIIPGETGQEAAADLALRPKSMMTFKDGVFSDGPTVRFYTQRVQQELTQEAQRVKNLNPSSDPVDIMLTAKSNLASRTIQTSSGPIVTPYKMDFQAVFGVTPANQAAIGPAIDSLLVETKQDASWQLSMLGGKLFAQEVDASGVLIGNGNFIDPKAIQAKIRENGMKEAGQSEAAFGKGVTVKSGKHEFKFNGDNSAGVPNGWMLSVRQNLAANTAVNFEGGAQAVRTMRKESALASTLNADTLPGRPINANDPSGNVFGPPVHNDPTKPAASPEVSALFKHKSDEAAIAGAKITRTIGAYNRPGFQLMTSIAYSAGADFHVAKGKDGDAYRAFVMQVRNRDTKQAQAAFSLTPVWKQLGDKSNPSKIMPRQRMYLHLIKQTIGE